MTGNATGTSPQNRSDVARTDPELGAYFINFTDGDIPTNNDLDATTRLMVLLASMVASQAVSQFEVTAESALDSGLTPVEIKEVVYQAVAYVGMAKVLDFVHATNQLLTARGVALPLPGQSTTTPETRAAAGLAVQKRIVGDAQVDNMYANAPADEQHFQRYLSANCFGDHLTRTGIDVAHRELLTFAMLVSLGGADAQVKGHVTGNLNVGNDRAKLLGVLTVLLPYIGYPRTLNGLAAVDAVTRS